MKMNHQRHSLKHIGSQIMEFKEKALNLLYQSQKWPKDIELNTLNHLSKYFH